MIHNTFLLNLCWHYSLKDGLNCLIIKDCSTDNRNLRLNEIFLSHEVKFLNKLIHCNLNSWYILFKSKLALDINAIESLIIFGLKFFFLTSVGSQDLLEDIHIYCLLFLLYFKLRLFLSNSCLSFLSFVCLEISI